MYIDSPEDDMPASSGRTHRHSCRDDARVGYEHRPASIRPKRQSRAPEAQWQSPALHGKPRRMPCGGCATNLSCNCTGDVLYLSIAELGPKCQGLALMPRVIRSGSVGS